MSDLRLQTILQETEADLAACVARAEQAYHERLRSVAEALLSDRKKVVLLAGPSGSGKTTTAGFLAALLSAAGHHAAVVSLDDFYRNPEEAGYPRTGNGELDFEAVDALAVDEIHECIDAVLAGREFLLPRFDFKRGRRAPERVPLLVPEGGYVIIEGLHALNPRLTEGIDGAGLFRLFISVSTNVLDKAGDRLLSGRRIRFLRRVSRDHLHRNASAARTYELWLGVVAGEEKYLYPFRNTADVQLDTFHPYEVGVLRAFCDPLLAASDAPKNPYVDEIRRGLAHFPIIHASCVPSDSLLCEFIPNPTV
ncbi:MAG: hypothetical protein IJ009_01280 [Clostridia bacterium]|nr:hypothetical protein [Clostridia bacterium]